ncbi:MarR family winged helix-turn-helix transcriptional regulator [Streptomyces sp. 8L]|uniref:MarR family winged helix-turn-helix transcriptional regulator n=1 Tax=Streptomyces sp. 8L TaxID=2877242 RepID=UPI001CD4AFC2|nr:MarR family transcriptional regulator [Streptomyces sp. 8L]MCA1221129.1 MarR family transcriptional regulator [Streptomyces sp. 8L]
MRKGPATRGAGADEPLGFVIASAGHAAALAFESALAAEDLLPRHFAVLRGLRDGEEHTQQQLASSLGIPASRLVGLLARLIERGLVERRESPIDARVKLVRLREEGRAELDELIRLADVSERRLTAGLTAEDRSELRRLLGIVYANVAVEPEGRPARVW